ncbi:MAG: hypothetical protein IJC35_01250 [Oscillospiraceae bacterium]|nr:hypothetical protein [Oscillospiraceae bacterium]
MNWNKLAKSLLFPHIAVLIVLLPVSAALVVYALGFLKSDSVFAILSYVLAFYTLTVWCFRLPKVINAVRTFRRENKYAKLWREDTRLRVKISLFGSMLWNGAYAVLQLGLGIHHKTFWFCSLAGYYFALAVMRFFLARYTTRNIPGEDLREELKRYRFCGIVLLVMNLALALMIFFMVYWNRTFRHDEITTIAMAAYTFGSFTMAIVNVRKYRKFGSPVYNASRAISLASACVSMLTLESTMLTTFGDGTMDMKTRQIFLCASGIAVSLTIILMAVYMIVQGTKKRKQE